jgi:hypothetical protein
MRAFTSCGIAAIAAACAFAIPAQAHRRSVPAHTKRIAERNVMGITPRSWPHSRIPMLIDVQTGLLRNNVRDLSRARPALSQKPVRTVRLRAASVAACGTTAALRYISRIRARPISRALVGFAACITVETRCNLCEPA